MPSVAQRPHSDAVTGLYNGPTTERADTIATRSEGRHEAPCGHTSVTTRPALECHGVPEQGHCYVVSICWAFRKRVPSLLGVSLSLFGYVGCREVKGECCNVSCMFCCSGPLSRFLGYRRTADDPAVSGTPLISSLSPSGPAVADGDIRCQPAHLSVAVCERALIRYTARPFSPSAL